MCCGLNMGNVARNSSYNGIVLALIMIHGRRDQILLLQCSSLEKCGLHSAIIE